MNSYGICDICLRSFEPEDMEDGCTLSADCCGRDGLCRFCRKKGEHDCDEDEDGNVIRLNEDGGREWEGPCPT